MKVLFAVSDENISESIIKEYQKQFREILSYKNVYYFNAIIKELQKDNSYDRIVISEDLEPFASNNYDSIDKFIFDKLDAISDEAIDENGKDTQIILITTDRRNFGDAMLTKFFGIGIYNALIGQDKSIEKVCELINRPRTKKEAKSYYKIDAEDVGYQAENENDVSETEIQNILAHYKKLGKNTNKYTESFNNIVSQYNDAQLKIIINFLPVGVKAILESESPKYQELAMGSVGRAGKQRKPNTTQYVPTKVETHKDYRVKDVKPASSNVNPDQIKIDMLENRMKSQRNGKPVVIPTEIENIPTKKIVTPRVMPVPEPVVVRENEPEIQKEQDEEVVEQPKRGRGRPKKITEPSTNEAVEQPKKGRGRPRKQPIQDDEVDLFNLDNTKNDSVEDDENVNLFSLDEHSQEPEEEFVNPYSLNQNNNMKPERQNTVQNYEQRNGFSFQNKMNQEYNKAMMDQNYKTDVNLSGLITRDKKIVSFVGTTKNGTSFVVNNLAELFSSMGISTAILDMTQSRNAYYIYTNNDESLRNIAQNSIENLRRNIPEGIKVNKNLTVYTAIPGTMQQVDDVQNILSTLLENYSLILIDCDFETPADYFYQSQEIYLVQSMDVLTIQPLTAFLRDLKNKDVLDENKLKIVINKEHRVSGLSAKMIIGGISCFNDPAMSFSTELFDRAKIKYTTLPFEAQNYSVYLASLVNCHISLKQYTKLFNAKLKELGNMVYPLIGQQYKSSGFGNNTLNRRY